MRRTAEKSGWLQGFSSDLFGWDEYISATGDTCVHMTSPEDAWLSADEADLFLGVLRFPRAMRPDQSGELPKRRRDYKYKAKFARLSGFDIVSVGPPPTAQNPMRAFTLKAFAQMDSRRARSTKTNLVWVDYDTETLLSTQATLILIAKKTLLPFTTICVGRQVSGPYGACIEYTVSTDNDGDHVFV